MLYARGRGFEKLWEGLGRGDTDAILFSLGLVVVLIATVAFRIIKAMGER